MRKVKFVTNCYYHIYNRGIEKRDIFLRQKYYQRFFFGLSEFNTNGPIRLSRTQTIKTKLHQDQQRLVDIVCYCLMPNHFHAIMKQLVENGITEIMHKLGTGYTMFFNKMNKRTGRLFEAPFKAKIIEHDEYFLHLSRYIHLNPVEFIEPNWKTEGIKDTTKAKEFLRQYKWSSYSTYIGNNKSEIISPNLLGSMIKDIGDYEKFVMKWKARDIDIVKSLAIDS